MLIIWLVYLLIWFWGFRTYFWKTFICNIGAHFNEYSAYILNLVLVQLFWNSKLNELATILGWSKNEAVVCTSIQLQILLASFWLKWIVVLNGKNIVWQANVTNCRLSKRRRSEFHTSWESKNVRCTRSHALTLIFRLTFVRNWCVLEVICSLKLIYDIVLSDWTAKRSLLHCCLCEFPHWS